MTASSAESQREETSCVSKQKCQASRLTLTKRKSSSVGGVMEYIITGGRDSGAFSTHRVIRGLVDDGEREHSQ